jgi:hypothetical protein
LVGQRDALPVAVLVALRNFPDLNPQIKMVGAEGLEPPTYSV